MRRRGNKSAKVPGVKLRPAQPGASSSRIYAEIDDVRVQDSQAQFDGDDSTYYDPTPRPFAGVVVCATGITDKPGIFKQAIELGATAINDFTSSVTHLIANEHGSAKYKCALEHKIPILQPSWITESYDIWLHGDDVDFRQSVKRHRLPIFTGVVLCVSGIPDVFRRTEISKLVMSQGGTYVKALQRPVVVTHLLCSGDEETDKMFYAEKFNKQGEADIKLVWEEWFWDSLEFGGRFDENIYRARRPRPQPRKSIVASVMPSSSSEQGQVSDKAKADAARNTDNNNQPSADDEETVQASVRKPVGFQRELWRSVLAPRGYTWNEEETMLIKSPTKPRHPVLVEDQGEDSHPGRNNRSVLSSLSFRRANSFAQLPPKQPLRRDSTPLEDVQPRTHLPPPHTPSIFSGLRFTALGEGNCDSVRGAIRKAGGAFVENVDLETEAYEVDIIIVRLVSGSSIFASIQSPFNRDKFRTECWLEKCLYEEKLCSPDDHVTFTPVGVRCPIPSSESVRISFSGFDQAERFFVTRLIKALGLTLLSNFSKRATHLLCLSAEGLKFEKAQEWGIPVVNMTWLEEMKRSGLVPDVHEHLISSTPQPIGKSEEINPKGKHKDTNNEMPIADITNHDTQERDSRPSILAVPSLSQLNLAENSTFGKPTMLLPILRPPAYDDPANSSITDPEEKEVSVPTSLTSVNGSPKVHASHSESDLNALTSAELQPDVIMVVNSTSEEQMNVPSSNTPSPIKPAAKQVGKGKGRAFTRTKSISKSPSKYYPPAQPIDAEATKALHESLSSLLGKRRSEESVDGSRDGTRKRGDRADGKRPRPMRTKVRASTTFNDVQQDPSDNPFHAFNAGDGNDDSFGFGHPNTIVLDVDSYQEQSMRVTYEDPEQRDEKRKLMRLLGPESKEETGKSDVRARSKGKESASAALSGERRRSSRKSTGTLN
ncbi:hypothetical protein EV368DRAFT_51751 [Lentinula lateritia]|nr:hypothetical protein EV368DRAFT_51751 [Lentinula lateritia]